MMKTLKPELDRVLFAWKIFKTKWKIPARQAGFNDEDHQPDKRSSSNFKTTILT